MRSVGQVREIAHYITEKDNFIKAIRNGAEEFADFHEELQCLQDQ